MTEITFKDRLALITKLEDLNKGIHHLDLHTNNLERENRNKDKIIADLQHQLEHARNNKLPPVEQNELDLLRKLMIKVWVRGESIYSPEVQEIVQRLPKP